jgi:hypothetical protein
MVYVYGVCVYLAGLAICFSFFYLFLTSFSTSDCTAKGTVSYSSTLWHPPDVRVLCNKFCMPKSRPHCNNNSNYNSNHNHHALSRQDLDLKEKKKTKYKCISFNLFFSLSLCLLCTYSTYIYICISIYIFTCIYGYSLVLFLLSRKIYVVYIHK